MEFIFRSRRLRPFGLILSVSLVGCSPRTPPTAALADGGDAQRLVALVDYVGGDYRGAVRQGRVIHHREDPEQPRFAAAARAPAPGPPAPPPPPPAPAPAS